MPNPKPTIDRVAALLVVCLGCSIADASNPESNPADDLGMDSLDSLEILIEIENHFNIIIADAEAEAALAKTVGDIVKLVDSKLTQ